MTDMAEITREQVERLRAAVRAYIDGGEPVSEHALCTAFDEAREPISGNEPDYVIDAWHESGFEPFHAALTRWRDSLPVGKVARWDTEREARDSIRDDVCVEFMRDVLALITRLRAADARSAWQLMETAPPGEWLAGLHGDRSKPPRVVMRIPTDVTALGFHDEHGNRIRGLTHWHPLPAPPASEVPRG